MKKVLKKIVSGVLAVSAFIACGATFTACETDKPEVAITLGFNGKSYTLSYQMNRKVTPKTVQHFIALADKGYYNETADKKICIHDYEASRWYTGGYAYTGEESEPLRELDYFSTVKSYIPQSVWADSKKATPTYTLYGEFSKNNYVVENGELKESFGSLVMYYETKTVDAEVYIERNQDAGKNAALAPRSYEYNSATSMFYISLGTSSKKNSNYCVFATLDSDSVNTLKNLQTAINDYIEDTYGEETSDFTQSEIVTIETNPAVVGDKTSSKSYDVPKQPIYLKSVKVTKY